MSRFLRALTVTTFLLSCVLYSTAFAGIGPSPFRLSGILIPDASGYAYLLCSQPIDAQNGPDVIIKGTIGQLPAAPSYHVRLGLVPRSVRDALLAGSITSLWGEGVSVAASAVPDGSVLSAWATDYGDLISPISRSGVVNDGSTYKLQLKPTLGRTGGTATLRVDGLKAHDGVTEVLRYGMPDDLSARTEDYSQAYLVAQVYTTTPGAGGVAVSASAVQLKDAVRVKKIVTRDVLLNEQTTFHAGEVVNVATAYRIISTRSKRIQYELRAEVALFGDTQVYSDPQSRVGGWAFTRSFRVPVKAKPGNYRAQITLKLVRHLTDRSTNEPYEQLLYTEEVSKKITVE